MTTSAILAISCLSFSFDSVNAENIIIPLHQGDKIEYSNAIQWNRCLSTSGVIWMDGNTTYESLSIRKPAYYYTAYQYYFTHLSEGINVLPYLNALNLILQNYYKLSGRQ
ncbi:MAG: conserved hypothetical protein [Methanobrevibacter sp. CfCl-M3]